MVSNFCFLLVHSISAESSKPTCRKKVYLSIERLCVLWALYAKPLTLFFKQQLLLCIFERENYNRNMGMANIKRLEKRGCRNGGSAYIVHKYYYYIETDWTKLSLESIQSSGVGSVARAKTSQ